jgi:ubiquinone biosynthesis accessory factor UbiK
MEQLDFITQLSSKIRETVAKSPAPDLEKNLHALLKGIFTKLSLVSRDEFDIQTKILEETRLKLKALEQKLAEIEKSS